MSRVTLSDDLTREHHEIDSAIETFIDELDRGGVQHELLANTLEALRRHIYLEEVILFPPLRDAGIVMPIFVMMREHGQLWRTMDTVAGLLADGNDSSRLRDICTELLDQLLDHNSKEEPVIYPNADTALPLQASTELSRFIGTGRTPDGWVCQHAVE
ncbi:hypothetical protein MULP_01031 [Mycobacterium liflandii 128FXT]|uniref:Hemerythrin-like domain-containing protein n=1 Tax=Mycobacterium liflandii (strain 128FXT) TaxID=459424 RepID=L7V3J1_MYCL1|nr:MULTISPECIES: hemerythrin domain-containing protein [Mycobacterium ulcerans group]AGC61053.1 hypothetical protein MULP_01031 [Mycobacterium liflandii 128FXT]